jgi:hypothetical protein
MFSTEYYDIVRNLLENMMYFIEKYSIHNSNIFLIFTTQ